MDKMTLETLVSYKKIVDDQKSDFNNISEYTVTKPWGFEKWLFVDEKYVVKLISMKEGHKSSLQSHKKKLETNYVIKGKVEVLLENEGGEMVSRIVGVGGGWTVFPKQKHRVIAITDYEALETSTPQLNDVIRYEDDTNRDSGKIEKEHK